jgi:hypothetical protein
MTSIWRSDDKYSDKNQNLWCVKRNNQNLRQIIFKLQAKQVKILFRFCTFLENWWSSLSYKNVGAMGTETNLSPSTMAKDCNCVDSHNGISGM